ncbi:hypothetical protein QYE76_015331 [Lolium multiflorum]|uniref:Aminotransferase-like plant mobile domain-containing protein n=1 Tax=Lolium multiflorum TaxID=4521 RepID=A0AAD8U6E1_LOLMU|nr:hypothetical protein QYE76_015331 [Lolium multiflorum]
MAREGVGDSEARKADRVGSRGGEGADLGCLGDHGRAAWREGILRVAENGAKPAPKKPAAVECVAKEEEGHLQRLQLQMVWLLDEEYDREHRAVHMTERGTDLHPLKIRYHGTVDIPYDERYTEFIQPTGLMPFISLVSRGGPNMNPSALTALVDRWRPETHTFHLRAGEMAPTLQDVSMILGLPIQGEPLCMNTASDGWRGQMEDLIGRAPPAPANPKERVPAGASFSWIRTNFAECPEGANEDTRRTYARVYLWLDRQRQRKITNWPVHHSGHIAAFQHCLEATRTAGPVEIVPHNLAAFNNYLQWFHENTRIELVKHAYADYILDDPIEFDEVAQSQHDTYARRGRSTSIASELNFVRSEIQKTAEECEVMWDQSGRDEKPVGPLRNFIKNTARKMRRLANLLGCREGEIPQSSSSPEREIPDDEEILSQSIPPKHTSKQAPRSAYQLKPRGNAPNRYTPEDYVNRGKKVVTEDDEAP